MIFNHFKTFFYLDVLYVLFKAFSSKIFIAIVNTKGYNLKKYQYRGESNEYANEVSFNNKRMYMLSYTIRKFSVFCN
ncbi:hypothetical protein UT300013_17500 [Paraclostridium sordellii]